MLLVALVPTGCGGSGTDAGGDGGCVGGKCDASSGGAVCDAVLVDHSLGGLESFSQLGDRLARVALTEGEACPASLGEILAKVQAADAGCDRVEAAVVSESAQLLGEGDPSVSYRAVISQQCSADGFSGSKLLFSLFGLRTGGAIPRDFEAIAFDENAKLFNYYELLHGPDGQPQWHYFGNSLELLEPYTGVFDHGALAEATRDQFGEEARCGACHTGGGLLMKELESPWLHWEGAAQTPGASALVDDIRGDIEAAQSGQPATTKVLQSDGIFIEGFLKAGNPEWNTTRREAFVSAGQARELLRPLFCTVETNVVSRPAPNFPDATFDVRQDMILNDTLLFRGGEAIFESASTLGFAIDRTTYEQARANLGTKIVHGGKTIADDTFFALTAVGPSFSDRNYVEELSNAGIIDDDLLLDVMSIDFTRPIYSDERCALLEHVPEQMEDIDPEALRASILESLEAAAPADGSAAADLRANLLDPQNEGLGETVGGFLTACSLREGAGLAGDLLSMFALRNTKARAFAVLEFSATLPSYDDDAIAGPGARLHPTTCEIVDGYVSAPIGRGGGGGSSALFEEDFEGPATQVVDDAATGTVDADWALWYDGDSKWGAGKSLELIGGAQMLRLDQGSFGIRADTGDISGGTVTLDVRFTPSGQSWLELLADDGAPTPTVTAAYTGLPDCAITGSAPCTLLARETPLDGEVSALVPPGTRALRVKLGSADGGQTAAQLLDISVR